GPDRIGEDAGVGFQRDPGIDQRTAAKPAADQHVDIGAEPEVEQAGAGARAQLAAVQLQFAPELRQAAGEGAGRKLLALLDDAYPLARAREPRGGDTAAIAGADHNDVVRRLDRIQGGSEWLLHRP